MSNDSKNPEFSRDAQGLIATSQAPERAILAQLITSQPKDPHAPEGETEENVLEELGGLAEAAGAEVVGQTTQKRAKPDAATLFGKGKVEEIKLQAEESEAEVLIVDHELSPAQGRNLENALKMRVIDRTELILDIFARRAQTRQAKLQVELAQLRYQLPRLKRMWTHLERQGGSIGSRGPGETQLETDKTLARDRISLLDKQLETIRRQKSIEQAGRKEFDLGALVGYTNVGKSALLNATSSPFGSRVFEANQLFATLGAFTRKIELGGGRTILLSDTVGLVRRLPHNLVESFHSTLAEVKNADFLLWVADGADPELEDKLRAVREVLDELEVLKKPHLLVLNQCDRLSADQRADLKFRFPDAVFTSAVSGEGLDDLREAIFQLLDEEAEEIRLKMDATDSNTGKIMSQLAKHGRIVSQNYAADENDGAHPKLVVEAKLARRWWELVGVERVLA